MALYEKAVQLLDARPRTSVSGMVDIEPIWRALGKEKAQALLHLLEQTMLGSSLE